MEKAYKLKLTPEDFRVLLEDIEAVMLQLEDFLADVEFNETIEECSL